MRKTVAMFLLMVLTMSILVSCESQTSPYEPYTPYCVFKPHLLSDGTDVGYASVMLLRANVTIPQFCYIEGQSYEVVVFDGFANPKDANQIENIELPPFITAISSHAYEHADSVPTIELGEHITSLGTSCLPKNLLELTISAEAICQTQTSGLYNALSTPETLEKLTINGTAQSTVDLRDFGSESSKLESITMKGEESTWPILPDMNKVGKVFLGWYTENPNSNKDAIRAVSGEKVAYDGMTVHPYWSENSGGSSEENVPVEGINIYRIYCFGISEDVVSFSYEQDTGEYVIALETTGWNWEWEINGKRILNEDNNVLRYRKTGVGKVQVVCYQCDDLGVPEGGAVMVEF